MSVSKDFEELLQLFAAHRVRYVICGGFAVAFHGKPRFTKDIDLFIAADPDNAQRIIAALAEFGFESLGLEVADLVEPAIVIQLGVAPNRVDLLTSIDGVEFENVWAARVAGKYGDTDVTYISKPDLVTNKTASARPQDLVDVALLTQTSPHADE